MNMETGGGGNIDRTAPPKWQTDLGLKPDDPAIPRLTAIDSFFRALHLPALHQSPQRLAALFPSALPTARERQELDAHKASPTWALRDAPENDDFQYGPDYLIGPYKGRPQTIDQNTQNAYYQLKEAGVEPWRILKSVAFTTPDKGVVMIHLRGDRNVDEAALAQRLGVEKLEMADAETLEKFGVHHGTVNPLIAATPQVRHIFDGDLVEGKDYPQDDRVFTSSGDERFYVGFDVRRYLKATRMTGSISVADVSQSPEQLRVFVRRPIKVIGGDSGKDTFNFSAFLLETITDRLKKAKAYFGDRSVSKVDTSSDPTLAGSIDTDKFGAELRVRVAEIARDLQKSAARDGTRPIVTFSSMAMHGIAGPILRTVEGIEYVGPQEALEDTLEKLTSRDIEMSLTVLLGLSSAYDKDRSAFAGPILEKTIPSDQNVGRLIQELVESCKKGEGKPEQFFDNDKILDKMLRKGMKGKVQELRGKNVLVVLGASELEGFAAKLEEYAAQDNEAGKMFAVIRSNDPETIASKVEEISAHAPGKIRLILMQPGQAVAELIARKTLESPQ